MIFIFFIFVSPRLYFIVSLNNQVAMIANKLPKSNHCISLFFDTTTLAQPTIILPGLCQYLLTGHCFYCPWTPMVYLQQDSQNNPAKTQNKLCYFRASTASPVTLGNIRTLKSGRCVFSLTLVTCPCLRPYYVRAVLWSWATLSPALHAVDFFVAFTDLLRWISVTFLGHTI